MIKHFCLLFKNLMSLNLSNIYTSGELLSLKTFSNIGGIIKITHLFDLFPS